MNKQMVAFELVKIAKGLVADDKRISKPIRLTQSELNNAQKTSQGKSYTIVTRPQADGSIMVAMVNVDTGFPIDGAFALRFVDSKSEVPKAIQEINRMFDKLAFRPEVGTGLGMFDKSRHRNKYSSKGLVGAEELEMSYLNSEERRIVESGALGWGLIALSDLWAEGITVSKSGKENPVLEKKAEKILENHYQRAKDKGVVFVRKER